MKLSLAGLLGLFSCSAAAVQTTLTLSIPTTSNLNPQTLPPQTHATLSTLHATHSAALSPHNTFTFRNLTGPASYLLDVHCTTNIFIPYRIDVADDGSLYAWETYRGNDWDNKGEAIQGKEFSTGGKGFEVRAVGVKGYFVERSKFSIVNIVMKNPMILMGMVTMGIFLGMPYMLKNMDPEMRREFEEAQRSNPMSSLLGGAANQAGGGGGNPMGNFDVAGFLAGGGSSSGSGAASGSGKKNGKR
ncbi:ER membrane protein complex subunit 7 like [Verticillium longisporum]|nr:ER membrane protein complex subunit 7 like [Verticillium longisporum]